MADIEIAGNNLIVHVRGGDRFLSLRSRLEVPLAHVATVEVNPTDAHGVWHGLRMGGTNVPGWITAGSFLQNGEWAFWDVHDPNKSIAIRLHDESYAKLVIGVDDPEAAALAIRKALQ